MPPIIKCEAAPVSAVNVIMKTLNRATGIVLVMLGAAIMMFKLIA